MIAKEALMQFKNELGFVKNINKQYSAEFAKKGAKIGSSVTIRKPARYTVTDGKTLNIQNVTEESGSLNLTTQKHVGFSFDSADLTLSIDMFKERYLSGAVLALANEVDADLFQLAAESTYNAVGTPGTTPSSLLTYLQARQKLMESSAPKGGKLFYHINPAASTAIVDALKGLFQSSNQIQNQYEEGMMGIAAGGKWYEAQNIYAYTTGAQGGTPLVNGAAQSGATLVTDGWSNSIVNVLKLGDVFVIDNVFKVNPITKQSTGVLQQFVITANVDSNGSGQATLSISPPIVTSGSTQTVDSSPADNAAITVLGAGGATFASNILCHKDAFTLATADLELPEGVHFAAVASDPESGLSMRVVRQYDVNNDSFPCRLDILYGKAALRPEWACRIAG